MGLRNIFPGTLWEPNFNGVAWEQPGGAGTLVFPQQQSGEFLAYPVPGQLWLEQTGLFVAGCGHWQDYPRIQRAYDEMLDTSVALVICALCSYIQYSVAPYDLIYNVEQFPIVLI